MKRKALAPTLRKKALAPAPALAPALMTVPTKRMTALMTVLTKRMTALMLASIPSLLTAEDRTLRTPTVRKASDVPTFSKQAKRIVSAKH